MRRGTPAIAALGRSLAMLEAILSDGEGRSVAAIAQTVGIPGATAHRQVTTLVAERFLARLPGGRLGPGPRLLSLLQTVDEKQVMVAAAAPVLHRLAAKARCVIQLGTLDEYMVTYRIKTGRGAGDFFTKVGLQLEAYCSGIGKVLLAHLPETEREAYLAAGPFVALTPQTITDPARLRVELQTVVAQGFARDDEEIAIGLACIAVPVHGPDGRVTAAISASRAVRTRGKAGEQQLVADLRGAAEHIEGAIRAVNPRVQKAKADQGMQHAPLPIVLRASMSPEPVGDKAFETFGRKAGGAAVAIECVKRKHGRQPFG